MLSIKLKKSFVSILTVALLFSVASAASVQAQTEDTTLMQEVDDNEQPKDDTPMLIMTQDGNVTAPDDQNEEPNLYQSQDQENEAQDNSTRVIAEDDTQTSQEGNLISTQTSPDYALLLLGSVGLIAALAGIVAFLLVQKRKRAN
ncbi:MAG: hypothetical protein QM398_07825 [Thermoproteota archaeon]|nr:hypothetical protein [Thermoproteota archaeon]NLD65785.1 hypothetical protein [Thermoproteota archaeon]